jgi:F0F1-type ATP synthase delta subunit
MRDDYTRLLEIAAESKDDAVAKVAVVKLVNHLRSVGRLKMLPSIAKELRKVQARRMALLPQVEVARKEDAATALSAAEKAGIKAGHAQVNPSLVSGWRASGGGTLIDRSGKRALVDIYRNVIS